MYIRTSNESKMKTDLKDYRGTKLVHEWTMSPQPLSYVTKELERNSRLHIIIRDQVGVANDLETHMERGFGFEQLSFAVFLAAKNIEFMAKFVSKNDEWSRVRPQSLFNQLISMKPQNLMHWTKNVFIYRIEKTFSVIRGFV